MRKFCLVAALGVAACVPVDDVPVKPIPPEAMCPAPNAPALMGQPVASYDFDAMDTPVRILPPGSMMTMDHNPARLNVNLDEAGNITRLWCG